MSILLPLRLALFLTMPVGFNFNLTYASVLQGSGIKIATVYRRSIFQVEWLMATLILQKSSICLRLRLSFSKL